VILIAAVIAASFFIIALRAMAIPAITLGVIANGREAARVMTDKSLGDDEKERRLQKASVEMMRAFGSITLRAAAALAVGVVPLIALQAAGIAEMTTVGHALATWQGIVLTGAAMTAVYFVRGPA
jgi:hypothetical protein